MFLNCCSSIHTQPPHWHPSPHIQLITIGEQVTCLSNQYTLCSYWHRTLHFPLLQSIHFVFFFLPSTNTQRTWRNTVTVLTCHLGEKHRTSHCATSFHENAYADNSTVSTPVLYDLFRLNISPGPTAYRTACKRKPSAWHVRPPSTCLTCPPNGCPKFPGSSHNPTPKPSYLLTNSKQPGCRPPLGPWVHPAILSSSALLCSLSQLSAPLQSFVSPLQGLSLYRQPLAPTRMCLISRSLGSWYSDKALAGAWKCPPTPAHTE